MAPRATWTKARKTSRSPAARDCDRCVQGRAKRMERWSCSPKAWRHLEEHRIRCRSAAFLDRMGIRAHGEPLRHWRPDWEPAWGMRCPVEMPRTGGMRRGKMNGEGFRRRGTGLRRNLLRRIRPASGGVMRRAAQGSAAACREAAPQDTIRRRCRTAVFGRCRRLRQPSSMMALRPR